MPTPNTPLSEWRQPLRTILGDTTAVYGDNDYPDAALDSAVRTVFALNKMPATTELHDDADAKVTSVAAGTNVYPASVLPATAAFAEILLRAALLLIGGDDGALTIETRAMKVKDGGDRKRRLEDWLRGEIEDIEAGNVMGFNPVTWNGWLQSRP